MAKKKKTKYPRQLGTRMTQPDLDALARCVAREDRSESDVVRRAIRHYDEFLQAQA